VGRGNMRTVVWVAFAAIAALAGCRTGPVPAAPSPPLVHIVNRSNTALVLGPGFLIPACGAVSTTFEAYEAARMKVVQILDGTLEVPLGAVLWDSPVFAGPEAEVTVVVSGTAPVAFMPGIVDEADLPNCGGHPIGVEPEVLPDASGPAVAPVP
jgi:hypothetical protein